MRKDTLHASSGANIELHLHAYQLWGEMQTGSELSSPQVLLLPGLGSVRRPAIEIETAENQSWISLLVLYACRLPTHKYICIHIYTQMYMQGSFCVNTMYFNTQFNGFYTETFFQVYCIVRLFLAHTWCVQLFNATYRLMVTYTLFHCYFLVLHIFCW